VKEGRGLAYPRACTAVVISSRFRHWQSLFPVSLFLGAFWWYLCPRTSISSKRAAVTSPQPHRQPCADSQPRTAGLSGFRPRGRGPVTGQQLAPIPQGVALYFRTWTCTCTLPVPAREHQAQQTCKRQCARGCPPCHSKTGSPHRHLRHPPRCRSADGFCLRLPRAVAQPALLHLFAVLQSESVRPAICDLLTVNRSPRAIRAGRPQTQQPPFRTIFSPATCRTSA
jgi:hypothetical protein